MVKVPELVGADSSTIKIPILQLHQSLIHPFLHQQLECTTASLSAPTSLLPSSPLLDLGEAGIWDLGSGRGGDLHPSGMPSFLPAPCSTACTRWVSRPNTSSHLSTLHYRLIYYLPEPVMAFSGGKLKQDCPSQSLYKVSDEED